MTFSNACSVRGDVVWISKGAFSISPYQVRYTVIVVEFIFQFFLHSFKNAGAAQRFEIDSAKCFKTGAIVVDF